MTWLSLAGWGTLAVCTVMLVLWLIHFAIHNAAIVDCGWGFNLALLGVGYACLGGGFGLRAAMLGVMTAVWGVRLALYLLFDRIAGHPEEGRYQELRRKWKTNIGAKFLAFYQFQALLCVLMSTPFLIAALNTAPRIHWLELVAGGLWFVAIIGEIAADAQLARFKRNTANKGRTCQAGLWRYSRHPNYFFEWLIWVSLALFASASPYGYLGWISPALMLYFLLRVTGIPATEAQALRSRGDDYRRYQETTSSFIPWFANKLPKEF